MNLKEFKEKVKEAVGTSLKLQKDYTALNEDYTKKLNEGYLGKNFVEEKLQEVRNNNRNILNSMIRPLLNVSREVEAKELERIELVKGKTTDVVFNELKLLSDMKPNQGLYQKYLDKYNNVPLAVEYIQDLTEKNNQANNESLIILNLPKSKEEFLHIFINRMESYLMNANIPNYNNYSSLIDFQLNGNIQSIEEDFNEYQEL